MSGSVAVVLAPMRQELAPFLARIGARPERRAGARTIFSGSLDGREVLAAVLGEGAGQARTSLEPLLDGVADSRFLLIGVAGGLSPGLANGALVRVETVLSDAGRRLTVERQPGLGAVPPGTVVCAPTIVGTAAAKRAFWSTAGRPERSVVDLESWVVGRSLERARRPFAIVRAVSDAADEDLPLDFARATDADGRVVRRRVLAGLLRRPLALGGLLALRGRVRECARSLSEVAERWVLAEPEDASGGSVC